MTEPTTPLASTSSSGPSTTPVRPSSLLPSFSSLPGPNPKPKRDPHLRALEGIRTFLQSQTCYQILPESFRLIVFDNKLSITRSLQALVTNGVVSAPLYDSSTQRFAGMFTLADVVHLIQYYYLTAHEYENVAEEVEAFQLESLRKIEQAIDVPPPPTVSVHPDQPLADACAALVRTHARRLPLVDKDDQTGKETIVSVLTQYRVLKFIAINCQHDCARLDQSIGSLGIGSYASWYDAGLPTPPAEDTVASPIAISPSTPLGADRSDAPSSSSLKTRSRTRSGSAEDREMLDGVRAGTQSAEAGTKTVGDAPGGEAEAEGTAAGVKVDRYFPLATATMETSVFDVVHIFSERGISAVPIVDEDGIVLNMYETVDIVDLVRQNAYQVLDKTIEDAIAKRSADFTGVITCTPRDTLASILAYIRDKRCHRFVIVEGEDVPADLESGRSARKKGSLVGILSLSDVLRYLVGHENLKGHEIKGLGLHGLRGVGTLEGFDGNSSEGKPTRPASFLSVGGSRRGSEETWHADAGV